MCYISTWLRVCVCLLVTRFLKKVRWPLCAKILKDIYKKNALSCVLKYTTQLESIAILCYCIYLNTRIHDSSTPPPFV